MYVSFVAQLGASNIEYSVVPYCYKPSVNPYADCPALWMIKESFFLSSLI